MAKDDFQKDYDNFLGQQVRILRDSLNLTQEEMAKKMGVVRQQYSKLENGKSSILLYKLQVMFNNAGLDLPSLIDEANIKYLAATDRMRKVAEMNDAKKYYTKEKKRRNKKEKT